MHAKVNTDKGEISNSNILSEKGIQIPTRKGAVVDSIAKMKSKFEQGRYTSSIN